MGAVIHFAHHGDIRCVVLDDPYQHLRLVGLAGEAFDDVRLDVLRGASLDGNSASEGHVDRAVWRDHLRRKSDNARGSRACLGIKHNRAKQHRGRRFPNRNLDDVARADQIVVGTITWEYIDELTELFAFGEVSGQGIINVNQLNAFNASSFALFLDLLPTRARGRKPIRQGCTARKCKHQTEVNQACPNNSWGFHDLSLSVIAIFGCFRTHIRSVFRYAWPK